MSRRVFLSYSSDDRPRAERLARALEDAGLAVWIDMWEVRAGDSLVEKVFDEGIARCDVFLFLLSESSLRSGFVRHELSTAFVRRLEGRTRIVPVRLDDAPAPPVICHLRWHDLSRDFEAGVRSLLGELLEPRPDPSEDAFAEFPTPPRRSDTSRLARPLIALLLGIGIALTWARRPGRDPFPFQGLGPEAAALADAVAQGSKENICIEARLAPAALHEVLPRLDHRALDEAAVVEVERASPGQLEEATGLEPSRLNRAVGLLRQYALAEVVVPILRPPYSFARVRATARTRRLARGDVDIRNLEPAAVVPPHVRAAEGSTAPRYTRRDRRTR